MFTITQSKPIFIGGIYKPFPVMDGLMALFYPHYSTNIPYSYSTIIAGIILLFH